MQAALDNSSLALHRVVRQMAKANALDFRVGHTGDRLVTHVAEIEVTRERAQGAICLVGDCEKSGKALRTGSCGWRVAEKSDDRLVPHCAASPSSFSPRSPASKSTTR